MLHNKSQIMWQSKVQKSTALFATEAEYYLAWSAGNNVLFLCQLLKQIGFAQETPTLLFDDKTACIDWGKHIIGGQERANYNDIQKHFAHEVIQHSKMLLVCISTVP
jgi:hypothetical protein